MADQPLLSDLCSICHINVPQYRCPGCSTRTCSLKCVQRHKEWAQCSGKRDPTAYVKKSQLATPAGIDHDYNFITGIERSRANVEQKLESRPTQSHTVRAGISKNKHFQDRLGLTRVNIEWAPLGMSRQQLNKTRWSKNSRRIIWAVEWIHEDGTSQVAEIHDSTPIFREYAPIFLKHRGIKKEDRKRKRDAGLPMSTVLSERHNKEHPSHPIPDNVEPKIMPDKVEETDTSPNDVETFSNLLIEDVASSDAPQSSNGDNKIESDVNVKSEFRVYNKTEPLAELLRQPPGSADEKNNYYYLIKPCTSGQQKVLVVISPTDCLLDCLQNQTILEFPSIQVLSQPAELLPQGFITEDNYLKRFKSEQDEMKRLLAEAGELKAEGQHEDTEQVPPTGLKTISNTEDILVILERDIGGV